MGNGISIELYVKPLSSLAYIEGVGQIYFQLNNSNKKMLIALFQPGIDCKIVPSDIILPFSHDECFIRNFAYYTKQISFYCTDYD